MQLIGLSSEIVKAGDQLLDHIINSLNRAEEKLANRDILVISSKVVALCQNRVRNLSNPSDTDAGKQELRELVKSEADKWIPGKIVDFTLKYNIIIPNAGIDKSNAEPGTVILWPEDPQAVVDTLMEQLKQQFNLNELGIIMIDSRCQPLRQGVSGISIAYSGIKGVEDNRGEPDLFGRPLKITQEAKADELAAAANIMMGEGNQAKPFVLVKNAPIEFTDQPQDSIKDQFISPEDCIFGAVFNF